ncbi:hypothetical protein JHK82_027264 [Glycine max]|nr:hypothetical protein JHK82_027264 [Glycine max]
MYNHEHANHSDTAQTKIKNKGIRQHRVNDQAQNIDFNIRDSSEDVLNQHKAVFQFLHQNYMSSANDPAINREALKLDDRTLQNLVLLEIEELLQANQRSLRDYPSMPYPEDANCPAYLDNSLILAELNYNNEELRSEFEHLFSHMTETSTMASASSTASSKDGDVDLNASPQALDKLLGYELAFKIKLTQLNKCVMDMLADAEQSLSVTADHDPLLGLPLTPTKRQAFQDCDDEAGTSQISPAQLSSNKLKKHGAI